MCIMCTPACAFNEQKTNSWQIFVPSYLCTHLFVSERVNHKSVTKLKKKCFPAILISIPSNNTESDISSLFRERKKIMLRKFNALEQDKHGMKLFLEINYGFGNLLKGLM